MNEKESTYRIEMSAFLDGCCVSINVHTRRDFQLTGLNLNPVCNSILSRGTFFDSPNFHFFKLFAEIFGTSLAAGPCKFFSL